MLGEHPIQVILLATDLQVSRNFYADKVGLEQASWQVEDRAAELAELRSRGVQIVEYDTPELKTVHGIVDTGDALHAWFVDPARNTLGMDQLT